MGGGFEAYDVTVDPVADLPARRSLDLRSSQCEFGARALDAAVCVGPAAEMAPHSFIVSAWAGSPAATIIMPASATTLAPIAMGWIVMGSLLGADGSAILRPFPSTPQVHSRRWIDERRNSDRS
jgi:hypothetical protein